MPPPRRFMNSRRFAMGNNSMLSLKSWAINAWKVSGVILMHSFHFGGRGLNRFNDSRMRAAAAKIVFHAGDDLRGRGLRSAMQQACRGEDHAGRAKAALKRVVFHERFL